MIPAQYRCSRRVIRADARGINCLTAESRGRLNGLAQSSGACYE